MGYCREATEYGAQRFLNSFMASDTGWAQPVQMVIYKCSKRFFSLFALLFIFHVNFIVQYLVRPEQFSFQAKTATGKRCWLANSPKTS